MNLLQVGRLIRKLRKDHSYTMVDFARIVNISQPSLSRIESGNQEVTFTQLEKICDEFGISLSDFFQRVEEKSVLLAIEEDEKKGIDIEEELDDELNKMISALSTEQKKGLYTLLLPYMKE
ncbi:helix-turn-helix domain-containing protein [Bacillus sp. PS06]|uniref:helix-turn-helix domain-containing protein n=1 Tax=Bacillus sp. PS06 TaxID=2764176 RepID=UPI001781C0B3|nr:helix-turn-helix transcriptional regulator [Bacillus sp. PS06]MBD8070006.1 helix-turn-helix transcriptional regulator [Bacillus sp. PS06]